MIVYKSKKAQVEWLEQENVVAKTFFDFIYGDDMKGAFNAGLNALIQHQSCKWLSDNRSLQPYRKIDVTWINEDWFPRMLKAGWKYWALVEPENALGQLSMTRFVDFNRQKGITLQIVHSVDDGLTWLNSL